MANPTVSVLDVLLADRHIGALTLLPGERTLFAFDDDYAADPKRPTLSLSFKSLTGPLVTSIPPTHVTVPPFFSNLLPEGHLRDYLAKRGQVKPQREFFLLWLLGEDLPGAVVVRPANGDALPPIAAAPRQSERREQEGVLRFSLAGVQLKFSAVMEHSGGLTIPTKGVGGSWIAKLPSKRFEAVPENELAMMTLAQEVGIEIPEIRLVPTKSIKRLPSELPENFGHSLLVKRFDRGPAFERIHIEDFAQVFRVFPNDKYDKASYTNMATVIWAEIGEEGIAEFVRRLAFNAFIGNADMHLKNWSLVYPDGRTPRLAPAYDFVATAAYIRSDQMALSIAGTKNMSDVSRELFERFAAKAGLPASLVVRTAEDTAKRFNAEWHRHAAVQSLPRSQREKIERHMRTVPLLKQSEQPHMSRARRAPAKRTRTNTVPSHRA
jgi:serine/threonine-protein kinase HipA